MKNNFLESARKQFEYYRMLGEKALEQVPDDKLNWQCNAESNSITVIIKHLHGNMLSRFTDFLQTDGEKPWRDRDEEFRESHLTRKELHELWQAGWDCLFDAVNGLTEDDLAKTVYIRNMGHTVTEALNRQLAHYPYHVGQIVFLSRMIVGQGWQSLSIPRESSAAYNAEKFSQPKRNEHFTDEYLKK